MAGANLETSQSGLACGLLKKLHFLITKEFKHLAKLLAEREGFEPPQAHPHAVIRTRLGAFSSFLSRVSALIRVKCYRKCYLLLRSSKFRYVDVYADHKE